MSKVVFVGNVPYNMGEEQLIDTFKSVGQVVGFRLVFDRDTGKPKGYGFCEFTDHDTAMSAVRNLNGVEVGGRPLRIDLADSDPFLEGKTTVRGELVDMTETRAQWREREREREQERRLGGSQSQSQSQHLDDPKAFLAAIPQGVQLPPGTKAEDMITSTLATMAPNQVMDVLAQMKAFVISHPDNARTLLVAHPQLGYALFQALVLNNIVDPSVLERMRGGTTPSAPPPVAPSAPPMAPARPAYQPPPAQHPSSQPAYPPMGMPPPAMQHHPTPPIPPPMYPLPHMAGPPAAAHIPPAQSAYYRPPPPPGPSAVPQQVPVQPAPAAPGQTWDPSQQNLLLQVLQLTQEQINTLPPAEREQINKLRQQYQGLKAA